MAEQKSQTVTLNTGAKMPLVGLGTWKIPKDVCAQSVENALKLGYKLLDCACDYGNEEQVGQGIAAALKSGIKREDIFVTSKLWNTYHAKEHVKAACERTLKDLGLKYLDLYVIHFPISLKFVPFEKRYPPEWTHDPDAAEPKLEFADATLRETWLAMEELYKAGLVKAIGVSNYNCSLVRELLKYSTVKPAVNQIEIHPLLSQKTLRDYCQANGIQVTGYSSFGPISYQPLGLSTAMNAPSLLKDSKIGLIAKAHGVSPAQVLLRWSVQRNVAVIPKSSNADRLKANLDVFSFELSELEMAVIDDMDQGWRMNDPKVYANYPIWD